MDFSAKLVIEIWDWDRFSKDDRMGTVQVLIPIISSLVVRTGLCWLSENEKAAAGGWMWGWEGQSGTRIGAIGRD